MTWESQAAKSFPLAGEIDGLSQEMWSNGRDWARRGDWSSKTPNYNSHIEVHKAQQQLCQEAVNWLEGRKEGNHLIEVKCPQMISRRKKKTQLGITKAIANVRPWLLTWLFADASTTAQ